MLVFQRIFDFFKSNSRCVRPAKLCTSNERRRANSEEEGGSKKWPLLFVFQDKLISQFFSLAKKAPKEQSNRLWRRCFFSMSRSIRKHLFSTRRCLSSSLAVLSSCLDNSLTKGCRTWECYWGDRNLLMRSSSHKLAAFRARIEFAPPGSFQNFSVPFTRQLISLIKRMIEPFAQSGIQSMPLERDGRVLFPVHAQHFHLCETHGVDLKLTSFLSLFDKFLHSFFKQHC